LIDKQLGHELVDQNSKWQLGQFIHETISNRSQLEQFHLVSYQRTSLKNISMIKGSDGPLWQSLRWIGTTPTAEDKTAVQCDVRLFKNEKRIELHFSIIKKSITDPEAIYIAFPFCMPYAEVSYEAQGGMVSPGKNQLEKTSSDWHAVQSFTVIRGPKGQVVLGSTEVPLVQFGDLNLGKFQDVAHVEKPHLFSWVMNNYWVTNFRASQEGEFKWHYFLTSSENPSMTDAAQFGWGSRVPFFCRVFPSGKESAFPFERSLIRIDAENILLVSAKPSSDGEDIILHLRETEGKTAEFSLFCLSEGPCMVTKVNVLGESIGNPAQKVRMKALESCFFKLERMR
jgi:alpha-mannosidase